MSHSAPFQLFLDKLGSHSALTEEESEAILGFPGYPAQVQSNRDFVRLGERVDHTTLVVAGLIGRFGQNSEGLRQITALHIPGDMADLHSVVAPDARSALQALTVSTVLKVPHDALREVASRYPAVAEAFWRQSVLDAAVLAEWVVNVGRRNARTRMAHFLCEMAVRSGPGGTRSQFSFGLPATQQHLADILALTAVHTNRTLKALREERLLRMESRIAHVLDWDGLAEAGEFDGSYLQGGVPMVSRAHAPPLRLIAG